MLFTLLIASFVLFTDAGGIKGRFLTLPAVSKPLFESKGRLPLEGGIASTSFVEPPPAPAPEPDGAGPEIFGPPKPYAFGYSADGIDGRSSHQETSDGNKVTGHYTLEGPDGINRVVHYIADQNGFRASVMTNEPGTESQNPSGIILKSSQPPAEQIALKYGPKYEAIKPQLVPHSYDTTPVVGFSQFEQVEEKPSQLSANFRTATFHTTKVAPIPQQTLFVQKQLIKPAPLLISQPVLPTLPVVRKQVISHVIPSVPVAPVLKAKTLPTLTVQQPKLMIPTVHSFMFDQRKQDLIEETKPVDIIPPKELLFQKKEALDGEEVIQRHNIF